MQRRKDYSSSGNSSPVPSSGRSHGDNVNTNHTSEYGRVWDVPINNNDNLSQHADIRLDERNRDANSNYARIVRKKHPRRHTVGGATLTSQENEGEDNTRKRQAFMDMLAHRYPQYSEKISGTASEDGYPVRTRRPRDHQRRRTVVTYNPDHNSSLEYEDPETMSNIEGPIGNFARGGFIRSSLPIVRSPPNTFDRPLGIVFLIYGNETKKAVLPNEITHLDTVRALFVRSFPGRLSMQYLQSSKRKIYILESKTNIYYLLEDLRDIKDRTVLKIHEYESDEQQRVREQTPEVRGKSTAAPLRDDTPQQVRKAQTLPQTSNMARSYPPFIEGYPIELERPKSHTLDSARGQPRGHPSATYARIAHQSPDRQLASPDRNLRPIPENLQAQNGYMQGNTYEDYDYPYQPIYAIHNHPGHPSGPLLRSMSPPAQRTQPPPGDPIRRAMSPPPSAFSQNYDQFRAPGGPGAPGAPPQTYVAKSTKAATGVHPSRATGPGGGSAAHSNRHSLAFTPMTDTALAHGVPVHQRSQSYRVSPDKEPHYMVPVRPRSVTPQPLIHDVETKYRMDQMEAQIANLAAWVQTAVSNESSRASSVRSTTPSEVIGSNIGKTEPDKTVCAKGVSDVSSASQHTVTQDIKESILTIKKQTGDLRTDLRSIRRMQQLNKESMQDSIQETMGKIKKALSVVPGTEQHVLRKQRLELDLLYHDYEKDKKAVMEELHDLESSVEETRADVITHQCRVNLSDVEGMALILSHITKSLGDLKSKFSNLQARMKDIMSGEMEIVVKEEKYLKDEPDRMEEALKRCKKLTGTLFTLKRLASVQEHRPPQMPTSLSMGGKIPSLEDKKAVLENIEAMVPNHDARVQSLEAADASRERKKKIVTQQEALKFGKSLEIASKGLKPALTKEPTIREITSSSSHTVSSVSSSSTTTKSTSSTSASKFSLPLSLAPDKHGSASSRHSHKPKISAHSASPPRTDKSGDGKSSGTAVSTEDDIKNVKISDRNNAARAAFFSSLTTPPTSPSEEKRIVSPKTSVKMDYTVRISPIRTSSSGETHYAVAKSVPVTSNQPSSTTKPTSLPVSSKKTYNAGYKSSTPSPNSPNIPHAFVKGTVQSNIPRFSATKSSSPSESSDKTAQSKQISENVNKTSVLKSSVTGDMKGKTERVYESSSSTSKHSGGKGEGHQDIQDEGHAFRGEGLKDTAPLISCELKHVLVSDTPKTSTPKPESISRSDDLSHKSAPFVKPKKVPPPPPPRKSSKHPSHVSALISAPADGSVSLISPVKMEMSQPQHEMDSTKMLTSQDSSVLVGYQIGTSQPGVTMTSTPKPEILPKPTKFEKGLALGLASEKFSEKVKDSGTLEKDKLAERKETDFKPCDHEMKQEDRNNSVESCSSLDSQQGGVNVIVVNRRSSSSSLEGGVKRPKPPPPKRHSSLSGQPKSDVVTEQIPNGKSVSQNDGKSISQSDGNV